MRYGKEIKCVTEYCAGCFFLEKAPENQAGYKAYCNYIGVMKHSRGCPAGDGCTKRLRKRRNKNEERTRQLWSSGNFAG